MGRPRRSGVQTGDPRGEILAAAAAAFTQRGVGQVKMIDIAESVGLGQSSLYYWFKSKQEIIAALMAKNRESLEVARRLRTTGQPASVRVFAILQADVLQMCSAPIDFYEYERSAGQHQDSFTVALADYRELRELLIEAIAQGQAGGLFISEPSSGELATLVLSLTEGFQHRWRSSRAPGDDSAEAVGTAAARFAVRALLCSPDEIDRVETAALAQLDLAKP